MARRDVAGFLDRGLQPRAQRVGLGIVVAPDAAVLEVDRLRQVRGQRQHAVVGDVVQPLDDLGDRRGARPPPRRPCGTARSSLPSPRPRPGSSPSASAAPRGGWRPSADRRGTDRALTSMRSGKLVLDRVADLAPGDRPASRRGRSCSSTDIATSMFVLNWMQPLARVGDRAVAGCPSNSTP